MALAGERHDAGERTFRATAALLFAASAVTTVWWCGSMARGMPMPGDWTMSMAWMRMPGQTWLGATATFMGMWIVMMVAMMLPSLVPMLSRYRRAVRGADAARLGILTVLAAVGYFSVWTVVGAAAYPIGLALAAAAMRSDPFARCVPIATGVVLLLAGSLQLTAWKARRLCHCREAPGCAASLAADAGTAWRHGLHLGVHCGLCCAGLMAVLLVCDPMDVGTMVVVAAAITAERLTPTPVAAARAVGLTIVVAGMVTVARALGAA
jgi:predicted metal-binding membrane protein